MKNVSFHGIQPTYIVYLEILNILDILLLHYVMLRAVSATLASFAILDRYWILVIGQCVPEILHFVSQNYLIIFCYFLSIPYT